MLTARDVRRLFYQDDQGILRWLSPTARNLRVGSRAGTARKDGYVIVEVGGKKRLAHRICWLLTHESAPSIIDHIDGDPSNNKPSNLREATHSLNIQNQRHPPRHNTSGYLGTRRTAQGNFQAYIKVDGKARCLGTYASGQESQAAYVSAKRSLHAGCTI